MLTIMIACYSCKLCNVDGEVHLFLNRRPLRSGLLQRHLGHHLLASLENHVLPPPLQGSLSLLPVRAPALGVLLLLEGGRRAQLLLEVVSCNQIRLQ